MHTAVVLPRPPHVVSAARAAVVPFALGAAAHEDGADLTACPFVPDTPDADRWVDGWQCARSARETERLDRAQALADERGVTGSDRRVLLAVALLGSGTPATLADPARATPAYIRAALHRLAGLGLLDATPAPTTVWGFTWALAATPSARLDQLVRDRAEEVVAGDARGMCPVCNSVVYGDHCTGCVIAAELDATFGHLSAAVAPVVPPRADLGYPDEEPREFYGTDDPDADHIPGTFSLFGEW